MGEFFPQGCNHHDLFRSWMITTSMSMKKAEEMDDPSIPIDREDIISFIPAP